MTLDQKVEFIKAAFQMFVGYPGTSGLEKFLKESKFEITERRDLPNTVTIYGRNNRIFVHEVNNPKVLIPFRHGEGVVLEFLDTKKLIESIMIDGGSSAYRIPDGFIATIEMRGVISVGADNFGNIVVDYLKDGKDAIKIV